MKHILITGKNSYIGDSFANYVSEWPGEYSVDSVSMYGDEWKKIDFSKYDSIYHVAGIAHRKETDENAHEYYEVNRDLAVSVAKKAKNEGVKQFIFLSSGTVYGIEAGVINKETPLNPKTHYGKSKAEAEALLRRLEDENFKVAILRPLMVYGKNCKGNFQRIINIVKESPVFPRVHNRRSLIYIDNLSAFVKMTVDKQLTGIYFPKNREDVDTCDIVQGVSKGMGKKVYMSWLLGWIIYIFRNSLSVTRKAFSDMVYEDTEDFNYSYCVCNNEESFKRSI